MFVKTNKNQTQANKQHSEKYKRGGPQRRNYYSLLCHYYYVAFRPRHISITCIDYYSLLLGGVRDYYY